MSRRPHPEEVKLSLVVPRGQDGFWKIIRALDAEGKWSINMVHGDTNVSERDTVGDYVRRLVKGGFARVVGTQPVHGCTTPEKLYRLVRKPAEAPSLTRGGKVLGRSAQERMWTAIRTLRQFTIADCAFTAGNDAGKVSRLTAERYVMHLHRAGYVAIIAGGGPAKAATFRLLPAMNTGPKAPKILRTHIVWDANKNKPMGAASDADEVAS